MPYPKSSRNEAIERLESRQLLSSVVGLNASNRIFQVNPERIDQLYKETKIKGLSAGDQVVGIDFRPASNELYGLVNGTSVDRIIKIHPVNGKTSTTFTLTTPLDGTDFGVDFNPVADALRITSNTGQNLRIPFANGTTIVDGTLAYNANDLNAGATPNIVASAYSNSFRGTTATILYNIDATLDQMTIQNPPNAGTQVSRGPLGLDTTNAVGFDIEGANDISALSNDGYVSLFRAADSGARLYRISLATGALTDVGIIGGADNPQNVRDITLALTSPPRNQAQVLRFQTTAAIQSIGTAAIDRVSESKKDDDRPIGVVQ